MKVPRDRRYSKRSPWRRVFARVFAGVLSLIVFSSVGHASGRYFYCSAMQEEREAPCCQNHRQVPAGPEVLNGSLRFGRPVVGCAQGTGPPPTGVDRAKLMVFSK
jgi:hypothetical protein